MRAAGWRTPGTGGSLGICADDTAPTVTTTAARSHASPRLAPKASANGDAVARSYRWTCRRGNAPASGGLPFARRLFQFGTRLPAMRRAQENLVNN